MNAPTFEQFQATRTACDDLGNANENMSPEWFCDENGDERKAQGFIYTGDCYIETMADGRFYLIMFSDEKISETLEPLERDLYQFCLDNEIFA